MQYSIIIPSRGDRPLALGQAIDSVVNACENSSLSQNDIEILIGFDGLKGERVRDYPCAIYYDLPRNNDYGNAIRHTLLKASKGKRIVFLDDDNCLTQEAFQIYEANSDVEMLIARIDVSLAHAIAYLPIHDDNKPLVRPCNIDPLCLCLSRNLVVVRCGGWIGQKYEADYENILRYSRRAKSTRHVEQIVGIYDIGRNLDAGSLNFRQQALKNK